MIKKGKATGPGQFQIDPRGGHSPLFPVRVSVSAWSPNPGIWFWSSCANFETAALARKFCRGLEASAKLERIVHAIDEYHEALDRREHGGVAQDKAFSAIKEVLARPWRCKNAPA